MQHQAVIADGLMEIALRVMQDRSGMMSAAAPAVRRSSCELLVHKVVIGLFPREPTQDIQSVGRRDVFLIKLRHGRDETVREVWVKQVGEFLADIRSSFLNSCLLKSLLYSIEEVVHSPVPFLKAVLLPYSAVARALVTKLGLVAQH